MSIARHVVVSTALFVVACRGGAPNAPVSTLRPTADVAAGAEKAKAPPSAPPTLVRTVEGIAQYRFDNGLTLLVFPDPSAPTITVNVTYLVGSRLEGYGETGMAHLLEHMMFKGTPRHRNVLDLLSARGAQSNGSTWTDRTNYFETLPATAENLDWALDLEGDRMRNASISPEDLSTEFSVVRNEFEIGENNAESILDERTVSTAFLWHNYGKATIGARTDIERVPVPALRAFYEKYYQPDNAVLIVAGKVDAPAVLAAASKYFGGIPRPSRALDASYTVEPVQDGERTVTLRRTGDVTALQASYHTVGAASPDYAATQAAIDVLTHEPSGRLYKKIVDTKLASRLQGDQLTFRDPYVASFQVRVADGKDLERVERLVTSEVEGLGRSKITAEELERWRNAELRRLELLMTDSARLAVTLSEYVGLGDFRTFFSYRDAVKKVTAEDVARVAAAYLKPSNRTLGRFIPTKSPDRAPLTEAPRLADIVKGVEGGAGVTQGEEFAATLENIEARTERRVLAGGLRAALLPKKTRGGKVSLRLRLHWGDERSLRGLSSVGALTAELLGRGTTKKSYQAIADLGDVLRATISIDGDADGLNLSIDTLRDHLEDALLLGAEMLTSPSLPEQELEVVRLRTVGRLERRLQDPQARGFNAAMQAVDGWPAGDPRHVLGIEEQLAATRKVTLADVRAFYRDFVGAGHGEVAVVGDFDAKAIGAALERAFGGFVSKKPYARLANKAFAVGGANKSIDTPDKENAAIVLLHDVPMQNDDPDYPAWQILGKVLGGDSGSRMWMRLREHEGLSYATGAWTVSSSVDPKGSLGAYAFVAPANAAKAKAAMLDEVAKLARGGVTAAELARAKEAWKKDLDTNLADDAFVVEHLAMQAYTGRTNAWDVALRAKVASLRVEDIATVASKWVQPGRLVVVTSGDQKKMKASGP